MGGDWVSRAQREYQRGRRVVVVSLMGLPGSGKSILASALDAHVYRSGAQAMVLDGDVIHSGLSSDLGYGSSGGRDQLRRVPEKCVVWGSIEEIVLATVIAPKEDGRQWLRTQFATEDFLLIYCQCSLSACTVRDPEAHYARARTGALPAFAEVSAHYEDPLHRVSMATPSMNRSQRAYTSGPASTLPARVGTG